MAVNIKRFRVGELIAIIQRQPGREHDQRRLEEAPLLRNSAALSPCISGSAWAMPPSSISETVSRPPSPRCRRRWRLGELSC